MRFLEIQISGILFRYDYKIISMGKKRSVESEEFPDQAFDSVSYDRVSHPFADTDPKPADL